jgi:hypothetical protein
LLYGHDIQGMLWPAGAAMMLLNKAWYIIYTHGIAKPTTGFC